MSAELVRKIESKEATVGVIGLGYVGLPLVLLFASRGFRVLGFDIDDQKVKALNEGESYIHTIAVLEHASELRVEKDGCAKARDHVVQDALELLHVDRPRALGLIGCACIELPAHALCQAAVHELLLVREATPRRNQAAGCHAAQSASGFKE